MNASARLVRLCAVQISGLARFEVGGRPVRWISGRSESQHEHRKREDEDCARDNEDIHSCAMLGANELDENAAQGGDGDTGASDSPEVGIS